MGLIVSERHSRADLERWAITEAAARTWARTATHRNCVTRAVQPLREFAARGSGYAGVSWGKDSLVLADMIARMRLSIPLVWVRVEPIANPDCAVVRDAFLSLYPATAYDEIIVWCRRDADGWHATGTLEQGFATAALRYGTEHVSGVRAEESGTRKLRLMRWGETTRTTCAPIGWWKARDVWAYLVARDLPIHPAYACTLDGLLDPDRLRVASLGGKRGEGMGRAEWERRYYPTPFARRS